jgi:hypothetical protein
VVDRIVAPVTGFYALQTSIGQGTLAIQRQGADGIFVVDPASQGPTSIYRIYLQAGAYAFTFTAVRGASVRGTWKFLPGLFDWESLTSNGVGQTSALSLRFLAFDSSTLTPESPPGSENDPPRSPLSTPSSPNLPTTTSPALSQVVLPVPQALLLTSSAGLLGRPSPGDGLQSASGSLATASLSSLGNGPVRSVLELSSGSHAGDEENPGDLPGPGQALSAVNPSAVVKTKDADAAAESASISSRADMLALLRSEEVVTLAERLGRWFTPVFTGAGDDGSADAPAAPTLAKLLDGEAAGQGSDLRSREKSGKVDRAELGIPIALLVVSAVAYRLRQISMRWWRRAKSPPRATVRPLPCRGPRFGGKKPYAGLWYRPSVIR